jgi:hypothetical protein|tara:strand:+ start:1185 stop:1595 length:411 start_codon:yes stop_codon:yes gene_type:complete
MKLYINNINIKNINFTHKENKINIYSDNGIYYFENDRLYKKNISYNSYIHVYKNYNFLIDDSEEKKSDEKYYIPYNSIEVNEKYYEYIINKKIILIKKVYLKDIEYYFVIDKLEDKVINNIISFILKYNIKYINYD